MNFLEKVHQVQDGGRPIDRWSSSGDWRYLQSVQQGADERRAVFDPTNLTEGIDLSAIHFEGLDRPPPAFEGSWPSIKLLGPANSDDPWYRFHGTEHWKFDKEELNGQRDMSANDFCQRSGTLDTGHASESK